MRRAVCGLALLVLAACGTADPGPEDALEDPPFPTSSVIDLSSLPACAELFAEGAPTSAEMFDEPCVADGEAVRRPATTLLCSDDRTLAWNEEGWAYIGEPWHRPKPDARNVVPTVEYTDCAD